MDTERLFHLAKDKKNSLRVVINSEEKVVNPYTTIRLTFMNGQETIGEVETIFKCDVLSDGCFFCFTSDFSSVVLTKNRERLVLPTTWQNVYLWHNSPVFEDQFFERVLLRKDHVVAKRSSLLQVRNFVNCTVERKDELYRLVLDNDFQRSLFTTDLSQEL